MHVAATSQQARAEFEPLFAARLAQASTFKQALPFQTLDEAIAGGSYFVGSPAEVTEQLLAHQRALGHEIQHIGEIDLENDLRRRAAELFVEEVVPAVRGAALTSIGGER